MENNFIELRQKKSNLVNNNGDWETTIKSKNLTLEEGDSLLVNKCFIDTTDQTSEKIQVENLTYLEMKNYIYTTNWDDKDKTGEFQSSSSSNFNNDCKNYILCSASSTPISGFEDIYKLDFEFRGGQGYEWGNFHPEFLYVNINGEIDHFRVKVPLLRVASTTKFSKNVNIIAKNDTLRLTTSKRKMRAELTKFAGYESNPSSKGVCHPFIFTSNIEILPGDYDPDNIAKNITDKLTKILDDDFQRLINYPVESNFLKTAKQVDALTGTSNLFIRADGNVVFQFNSGMSDDYYIGSDQISLEYDDEASNRFMFSFLHGPFYDNSKNIIAKYVEQGKTGEYRIVSRNGGILWASLVAYDSKLQEPIDDWFFDKLGFDTSNLCVNPTYIENTFTGILGGNFRVPTFNIVNGVNATEGLKTLDIAIEASNDWYKVPSLGSLQSTINTLTTSIYADKYFLQQNFDFGYFLIEISANFENNLFMEDTISKNISAIVSRYYEVKSYTSATTDSAIIYTHKGNSQSINSFKIRILNSDHNLAQNIGEDNTIFLQLVKADTSNV